MGSLHYAFANIRKNKSSTLSLFAIILIVSMLMNTGLTVIVQSDRLFQEKVNQLDTPHNVYAMSRAIYQDRFLDFFKTDPRIEKFAIENTVLMGAAKATMGGEFETVAIFADIAATRDMTPVTLIEQDTTVPQAQAIYLPYFGKLSGYKTGDTCTFIYKNKSYDFTVAGFFESIELSTPPSAGGRYYVSSEAYDQLAQKIGESVYISARFTDASQAENIDRDFRKTLDVDIGAMFSSDSMVRTYQDICEPIITPVMSISGIVAMFAMVLTLISLVVINFRVKNSIEDNLHSIGVLEATGYTSRQIIRSLVFEYALVSLPAALLGVLLSALTMPGVDSVMASASGVLWELNLQIGIGLLSSLGIAGLLVAMVYLSARRIKKLPPVVALRGGIATHSFRRNHFPLSKGVGGVHARLGFKNMFMYGKLYLTIGVILAGIALAITFVMVAYSNFVLDRTAFIKMAGAEMSDITLVVSKNTDANMLASQIETMSDVRKTSMVDWSTLKVDGFDLNAIVSNDYSALETISPYEGAFPQWDNEIVLSGSTADNLGKTVGDRVQVAAGGVTQEFLISGLYSSTTLAVLLTQDGYQRMVPTYQRHSVNVYLKDGVTVPVITKQLEERFGVVNVSRVDPNEKFSAAKARAEEKISAYLEQYGINSVDYAVSYRGEIIIEGSSSAYQIESIQDFRQSINTQIDVFSGAMSALAQIVAIFSVLIVALILSMVLKTIVIKRRVELGILKASGFQTKQLAAQLAISFMPSVLIGSIVGCLCGAALVNPAFKVMFSSMGITNIGFTTNPIALVVVCLLLVSITFGLAMLSAFRIRKISVYALLSE